MIAYTEEPVSIGSTQVHMCSFCLMKIVLPISKISALFLIAVPISAIQGIFILHILLLRLFFVPKNMNSRK